MQSKSGKSPVTLPVRVSDMEFNTVLDTGFFGDFALTPTVHSHPYFELTATVGGCMRIAFSNGEYTDMSAGNVCLIPPDCYHSTGAAYEGTNNIAQKLSFRFSYHRTREAFGLQPIFELFDGTLSEAEKPVLFMSQKLCGIMKEISGELHGSNVASDVLVQSLMQQMYIELFRLLCLIERNIGDGDKENVGFGGGDSLGSRYYRIETYFSENYSHSITADDLASELGLSKRQLNRVFTEIYGMSFRKKLIETRLYMAARLLTTEDTPIEEIAYKVGYTSASGFYVTFTKFFGMSGSEYRRRFTDKKV